MTQLSIIIVFHDEINEIIDLLNCLSVQTYKDFEIIIVDSNSKLENNERLKKHTQEMKNNRIKILASKHNIFYAAGNNKGLKMARGEFVCIMNPDIAFGSEFLEKGVNFFLSDDHPDIFAPKMNVFAKKNVVWYAGAVINPVSTYFSKHIAFFSKDSAAFRKITRTDYANGACLFIRRAVLEKIGGFDEIFLIYVEETDLNLRARAAGFSIFYNGNLEAFHKVQLLTSTSRFGNRDTLFQYYLYTRNKVILTWKNFPFKTIFGFYFTYLLYQLVVNTILNIRLKKPYLLMIHLRALFLGTLIGVQRRTHQPCGKLVQSEYKFITDSFFSKNRKKG